MHSHFKTFILVAASAVMCVACAPEEKDVCKHMMQVYEGKPDMPKYLENMDACVDKLARKKARHGVNSYRREVECVLEVDTSWKVRKCIEDEDARRR